jgi:hypothetical protein
MELPSQQNGQGQAMIRFYGKSTLHDFSGSVKSEPFGWQILTDPNTQRPIVRGQLDVVVETMNTHNKDRDKNMHAMFESKKFPRIHGAVQDANLAPCLPVVRTVDAKKPPREIPGKLPILVTIRDTRQTVTAEVSHLQTGAKEVTFSLAFELSLKSFGLKPPSVLGIIRVGDKIRIEAEVTLTPKKTQVPPVPQGS